MLLRLRAALVLTVVPPAAVGRLGTATRSEDKSEGAHRQVSAVGGRLLKLHDAPFP